MSPLQFLEWDADSFSYWAQARYATTPEKKLLVAVIQRAILDYLGRPEKIARKDTRQLMQKHRAAAFEFLFSPENAPWSFRWICDQLSEDGTAFALKVLEGVQLLNNPAFMGLRFHAAHYRNFFNIGYDVKERRRRRFRGKKKVHCK